MAKICIMCDQPAGSREHVFPAAFGGRRINRGIYCESHNNELGHHVVELLKVLSFFNASLGVRSDHHDDPKPHLLELEDGQRYQLLNDHIEVAPPPPLRETPDLLGTEATFAFASRPQWDRWLTQQKKDGFEFSKAVPGELETKYFAGSLKQGLTFGSEPFRGAIAYLGLTLLAHYFPELAREESLLPIRRCVLGEEPIGNRFWWVDPSKGEIPTDISFSHVHSATIGISGETGQITVVIAFFKHLCVAVDIGVVTPGADQRVTTLIDPLAQRPQQDQDIRLIRDSLPLKIPTPEEGIAYLHRLVNGEETTPVSKILQEHHQRHLSNLAQHLHPRLMGVSGKDTAERLQLVEEVIEEQGQRILNLVMQGLDMSVQALQDEMPAHVIEAMENAIVEDASTEHGLSEMSMDYLILAKTAMTEALLQLIDTKSLSEETLSLLFGDGLGIATATKPVLQAVLYTAIQSHDGQ